MAVDKRANYMREYRKRFKAKHGCSPVTLWRRNNPEGNQRHRDRETARWHREPEVRRKHKEKGVMYRFELKVQTLDAYGGVRCICCGEQELAFLTLDHVDNDGAEHRRLLRAQGSAGVGFYSYLRARGYPNKPRLQVLCYNCNCGKRANNGICPHTQCTD